MEKFNNQLFVKTIDDLKYKSESNDSYDLLMCSGLIRKLLIDGDKSLLHIVNKHHRMKISFQVTDTELILRHTNENHDKLNLNSGERFWCIADGLDPDTQIMKSPIINITLDKFLSSPVMQVNNKKYSIKDLVLFFANSLGGVHRGNLKSYELVLKKYFGIKLGNISAIFYQQKSIIRVIIKSLSSLYEKVALHQDV